MIIWTADMSERNYSYKRRWYVPAVVIDIGKLALIAIGVLVLVVVSVAVSLLLGGFLA